jgi:hypothetical protein
MRSGASAGETALARGGLSMIHQPGKGGDRPAGATRMWLWVVVGDRKPQNRKVLLAAQARERAATAGRSSGDGRRERHESI